MEDIKLTPFIEYSRLEEIFKKEDKTEPFYEELRPKIQTLLTPILNNIEEILEVDIFWHSKISVYPSLSDRNAKFIGYGIEPRKNEAYYKDSDVLRMFLRFEIHSPAESGVYMGIKGKYEKSRFAFLFHQHPEDIVNLMQNAFVYVKFEDNQVDLTSTNKILDFLDVYFGKTDEIVFYGPVEVTRPKEEIYAGAVLRFLTLFPIYQSMIECSLSSETNFKGYIKRVFEFLLSP